MGSCLSKEAQSSETKVGRTTSNTNQNIHSDAEAKKHSIVSVPNNSIGSHKDETSNSSEKNSNTPITTNNHAINNNNNTNNNNMNNTNGELQYKNSSINLNSNSNNKEIKILLLGSGESGKSTIIKQMKILHQNGYTREELYEYKPFVYRNVLECIKNIINAVFEIQPILVEDIPEGEHIGLLQDQSENGNGIADIANGDLVINVESVPQIKINGANNSTHSTSHSIADSSFSQPGFKYEDFAEILNYEAPINPAESLDQSITKSILKIYRDIRIQKFIQRNKSNFYLMDSAKYFFDSLPRISTIDYIPSVTDILRTRKKTSGIFDTRFSMGGLNIHMYDVGGQRSERKKWIHCFDNVTLIIFCVALSEYNQVLLEENTQNRLEESLILFDSVVNSRWFLRTSIVLFLNKVDVFAEKLPSSPLENFFPDYTGGNDINKAAKYILWRFTQVNRSGLNIYPHVTQATDTSNIQLVFAAVKETILENSLRDSGIL